jgi:hypothetical protein
MTPGGLDDQSGQPEPGQSQPGQRQAGPPEPQPDQAQPHQAQPHQAQPHQAQPHQPQFGSPPPPPQYGPPPPQYGPPPPQYGPPRPQYGPPGPYGPQFGYAGRRTNNLAIAAICCGIGQVIAGPFAAVPAIILGVMSLGQVRQTGEDGRGMAIAGIVLGIAGLILDVIFVIIFIAFWHHVSTQFPSPPNSPGFP